MLRQCRVLQEFRTIWHSWLTMFNFMVSGFEFGIFYECHNPEAAIILVVLYMFVVAVIFLNLLVGVMTDSWSKVTKACDSAMMRLAMTHHSAVGCIQTYPGGTVYFFVAAITVLAQLVGAVMDRRNKDLVW